MSKLQELIEKAGQNVHKARYMQFSFPEVVLEPGEEKTVEVKTGVFRVQKLVLIGFMEEVRGHFKIRYSRLPLLNRENVLAYSNVTRVKSKRRTTVEYREHKEGNFVRSYRPENVVYHHVDPLSYVMLTQMFCGNQPAMHPGGVPSFIFRHRSLGVGLPFPTTNVSVAIVLKNNGDIQVRVFGTLFGIGSGKVVDPVFLPGSVDP